MRLLEKRILALGYTGGYGVFDNAAGDPEGFTRFLSDDADRLETPFADDGQWVVIQFYLPDGPPTRRKLAQESADPSQVCDRSADRGCQFATGGRQAGKVSPLAARSRRYCVGRNRSPYTSASSSARARNAPSPISPTGRPVSGSAAW